VVRAQRDDALPCPAIAITCPQSVSVEDAGDEIVIGDQRQLTKPTGALTTSSPRRAFS
jgi:hypothetical protein